jgi:hypothetical protein
MKRVLLSCYCIVMMSTSTVAQLRRDVLNNPNEQNFEVIVKELNTYYKGRDRGRGSGYKQFRRWEMLQGDRLGPDGNLTNYAARNFAAYKKLKVYTRPDTRATNGYWSSQGPTDYTLGSGWNGGNGRVNCITFHPSNSNIIYLGTPAGGLWRTTNGGTSWSPRTDGIPSLGVSGVAVNPDATSTVYILTGDGDGIQTYSVGVLKTTNGGTTWNETGLSWGAEDKVRGFKLLMHPDDPDILFVASTIGIIKTTDGGISWDTVFAVHMKDIEFKPGDPTIMYATSKTSFYKSTTTGDIWTSPADNDLPASGFSRIAIGVSPANSNYVYLLYGGGITGFKGLYRSFDSGENFSLKSNTPNIMGYETDGSDSSHQAGYDIAIAVDPDVVGTLYTGGINVWKSTNFGSTWTITSDWVETTNTIGYTHADIHALEFNGSNLFCGSDGGVFKSVDGAINWSNLSDGLVIMQFYKIDVEGSEFIGGTQDNGSNQWTIGNTTALHVRGGDGFAARIDYTDSDIRYASTQNGKYKSVDGGASWDSISPFNLVDYQGADWILDLVDPDIQFLGQFDVYRTTSAGVGATPWDSLDAFANAAPRVRALAQGVNNRNRLYAGKKDSIMMSANALNANPAWSYAGTGLPFSATNLTDIALDPTNSTRVWATFSGYSDGDKVFFSSNAGTTWTNVSGNLPNVPVNAVIYDPGSSDGIYVGTDLGIFYRDNNLGDWVWFNNGLPTVPVYELDIEGSYLYAGTFGRGLWRSTRFSSCPPSYVLTPANDPSDPLFTGIQRYRASSTITSTRIITGGVGTDVLYQAGNSVDLLPGFRARRSNVFAAHIGGCNEGSAPLTTEDDTDEFVGER